ncbi:chromatin modification- protein eaf6 [Malassezia yamatoensis]|uniref:Chromatin modification-related protein EAF6 n=1 Tax=Malassezia yamatoensis TaxID=253288 RepID=A0AAJ6CHR6_9BASI|nr:chromatin modification- protein eaf6 [Malassezia yamatoensis]
MTPAASTDSGFRSTLDEANERYDTIKAQLKDGLAQKRQVDQDLTDLETQIYLYEGSYLNSTALSGGNVIRGFDSYMKTNTFGNVNARGNNASNSVPNDDRVFSTSSATHHRSLALKMNEAAEPNGRPDDNKSATDADQPLGYKLKRKT